MCRKDNGEIYYEVHKEGHFNGKRSQMLLLGADVQFNNVQVRARDPLTAFQAERKGKEFSSTENLIGKFKSNSLALLHSIVQITSVSNKQSLRASSKCKEQAMVSGRESCGTRWSEEGYNAKNQERPFQRNNARGNGVAGNVGGQNRGGIIKHGQAKPIKCYNCSGLGHIATECPKAKETSRFNYFKDKMQLMQAQESGCSTDRRTSLFLQENSYQT
ncbi:retrovirus-related pol polyprotein from transposon TNT 1-94 [Tanacetum coccineum]|uniref:Retrovirus-related pol polyprotein from transposon TNT 1-94 n=1 Tax=Tanacetum coccineum TaxID=301880 RepID=A0ABQ5HK21_9ASTR